MSSSIPPDPYFNNINFNPNFFKVVVQYLTETIANSKYLRLIGGVLTGNLGIKITPKAELDINGQAIINNNLYAVPNIGILGGTGSRVILTEGTAGQYPFALGCEGGASGNMWYGVPTTAGHSFFIGASKPLIINNSGNVGIGFTNTISAGSKLNVNSSLSSPNTTFPVRISAGAADNLGTSATLIGLASETALAYTKCAIGHVRNATFDRGDIVFLTNNDATTNSCGISDEKMRITSTGDIRTSTTATFYSAGSFAYFGAADTSGLRISKNDIFTNTSNANGITIFTQNTGQAISLVFFGGNGIILSINNTNATFTQPILVSGASAKIGIGTSIIPTNILQVGDGARLKISNNGSDFSVLGTKETDDANNTKILINGYQRAGQEGDIKYIATTATGKHRFFLNNSTEVLNIDQADFTVYKSITTVGDNYYTDGKYYPCYTSGLINTAGQTKIGYFIPTEFFFNSLIMLAISHNSTTYTYWHGRVSTNNSTQILNITNFTANLMNIESFTQQTTNLTFIYVYPTTAYSSSDPIRVKFYG